MVKFRTSIAFQLFQPCWVPSWLSVGPILPDSFIRIWPDLLCRTGTPDPVLLHSCTDSDNAALTALHCTHQYQQCHCVMPFLLLWTLEQTVILLIAEQGVRPWKKEVVLSWSWIALFQGILLHLERSLLQNSGDTLNFREWKWFTSPASADRPRSLVIYAYRHEYMHMLG